jgi:magnesium transporter
MRRLNKDKKKNIMKSKKIGQPPGTLVYVGDDEKYETKIRVIDFNKQEYEITEIKQIDERLSEFDKRKIRWIDITGYKNVEIFEDLGKILDLHPLLLEDILNPNQRPKFEDYGKYIFVVLKNLDWKAHEDNVNVEQINLILGPSYVVSIAGRDSPIFDPIIERIKTPKGRVRFMGADYLMYALIDVVIDNYFTIQDVLGDYIEDIEDKLIVKFRVLDLQLIYPQYLQYNPPTHLEL